MTIHLGCGEAVEVSDSPSGGTSHYHCRRHGFVFASETGSWSSSKRLYLIGSLRNPQVPVTAAALRKHGFEVFDDWYSAGPRADDHLWEYEQGRGRTFREAVYGAAATNAFLFDKRNIDASDAGVLLMPAGKSGHLELGYMIGAGKPGFVLLDKVPERLDIMLRFATDIVVGIDELVASLKARL